MGALTDTGKPEQIYENVAAINSLGFSAEKPQAIDAIPAKL